MNLQTMSRAPTALNLPEIYFRPIRVEIPEVILGFVYVLVGLKDNTLKTTYVGQPKRSVLTRLHEHNIGYGGNFTFPFIADHGHWPHSVIIFKMTVIGCLWRPLCTNCCFFI